MFKNICIYTYILTIYEKRGHELKESKEGVIYEGPEGVKGRRK